jgi:Fe-Mn family superoxide dismutase
MPCNIKRLGCDPAQVRGMSERLIVSHYENDYRGAVMRLNMIEEKLAELDPAPASGFFINGLKREELIAMNSMILHELFFDGLGGQSELASPLKHALAGDFGSYERRRSEFERRLAVAPDGCCCNGRPEIESLSINGHRTTAIRWRAARRSLPSICMSTPIASTSAPRLHVEAFMGAMRWSNADRLFSEMSGNAGT